MGKMECSRTFALKNIRLVIAEKDFRSVTWNSIPGFEGMRDARDRAPQAARTTNAITVADFGLGLAN